MQGTERTGQVGAQQKGLCGNLLSQGRTQILLLSLQIQNIHNLLLISFSQVNFRTRLHAVFLRDPAPSQNTQAR